jgi:hypothetical protein
MTVQLIVTMTRPSTDIPWHSYTNGKSWFMNDDYYLLNWHDRGRIVSTSMSVSEDGLTGTFIREFSDWQSLDDFYNDKNLSSCRTLMNTYNDSMGIETINLEIKEI